MNNKTNVFLTLLILFFAAAAAACAQESKDLDNYKWRVNAEWWFSHPSGFFGAQGSNNYFDIHRDFGFGDYSTFAGLIDYRFRRKHHLLLNITPNYTSKSATLNRVIDFQGQEFAVGAQVDASLSTLNIAPGYQYDIFRRNRGFLGLEVDVNLIDTKAKLELGGSVNGQSGSASGSASVLAPLPALGPVFRWYPMHNSSRLSLEGSARGMYFFGYGDFVSARGNVNVGLTNNLAVRAGYEMGSRLSIHGTSDQIGVRLTHRGPTAGIEYSWGQAPTPKKHKAASAKGSTSPQVGSKAKSGSEANDAHK